MEIDDVTCPICLYIIIKPVTLPCNHHLCLVCFERNVKEANFCCPICRLVNFLPLKSLLIMEEIKLTSGNSKCLPSKEILSAWMMVISLGHLRDVQTPVFYIYYET